MKSIRSGEDWFVKVSFWFRNPCYIWFDSDLLTRKSCDEQTELIAQAILFNSSRFGFTCTESGDLFLLYAWVLKEFDVGVKLTPKEFFKPIGIHRRWAGHSRVRRTTGGTLTINVSNFQMTTAFPVKKHPRGIVVAVHYRHH